MKFDVRLVLVLILFVVVGASLVGEYRYQINPDGISYISVARKYLAGDFSGAINGYWGPIYSWLLMPFLYFGIEALLASKVLALAIGVATLIGLWRLSYRLEMTEAIRTVILLAAVPAVLTFGFFYITPDALLTCIILFYLSVVFGAEYEGGIRKGIVCGALGGAAYLSKSFAFPFFISHFVLMNAVRFLRSETGEARKKIVHNFLAGAAAFAIISGLWIGLISNKYGKLTFGTSGKTTYRAAASPGAQGSAVLWIGLLEPPDETAMSAWEDPSYVKVPPPEATDAWSRFGHQMEVVGRHVRKIGEFCMEFSPLALVIGVAYVLLWLRRFNINAIEPEVLYPTLTIALMTGAYSLVWVRDRYLYVIFMLMMLMGGYVLGRLFASNFFTKTRRWALLVVFFLSFMLPASQSLNAKAGVGRGMYGLGQVLKNVVEPGSNIASNDNWGASLFLSYHLGCRYYGAQEKDISRAKLERQLEEYEIDYYLAWGGGPFDQALLVGYQEITGGRIPGLRMYSLKNRR
ncbi:MAG: glycosyltransferase family 39 protein [Planctomycetota bacterium]|nr:MAG: glycosyltransferase family 39 protein [Planctomycetota bacterium]